MPSLATARAANAKFAPSYLPVALFVGGTSGIGQATAEAFPQHTKGNAHIIICGRNRAAAEAIIAKFPKPTVASDTPLHEFVHCDVVLMKNVQSTTSELLARLPKLNFLVLSTGILTMKGRDETVEGIDKKLALHYYSRFKFTYDLMPLLQKAADEGDDAKVLAVLGAGHGGKVDLDDLGLKKHFSLSAAAQSASTYTDCMIEEFAARNPKMAFTHMAPGVVRTPLLRGSHWTTSIIAPLVYGLTYPISIAPADCAEQILNALLSGERGAFRRDSKGEELGTKNLYTSDEVRKRVWEHSVDVANLPSHSGSE